jgi:hypothetical protein
VIGARVRHWRHQIVTGTSPDKNIALSEAFASDPLTESPRLA